MADRCRWHTGSIQCPALARADGYCESHSPEILQAEMAQLRDHAKKVETDYRELAENHQKLGADWDDQCTALESTVDVASHNIATELERKFQAVVKHTAEGDPGVDVVVAKLKSLIWCYNQFGDDGYHFERSDRDGPKLFYRNNKEVEWGKWLGVVEVNYAP